MDKKKIIPETTDELQSDPGPLEEINDTDITPEEKELLEKTEYSMAGPEDQSWEESKLDNTDDDGEPLNEVVEFSGEDLDLPMDEEDSNKIAGEEDEENDTYSLGGDRHDD
jgi:hypothetical protein